MARVTGGGGFMPFFVPHLWSPFWEMGWGGGRARARAVWSAEAEGIN